MRRALRGAIVFLLCGSCSVQTLLSTITAVSAGEHLVTTTVRTDGPGPDEDVSKCILFFGAYCNGNLGDAIQASTMARLIAKVASEERCVWHAHPSKEVPANGFREGEFFATNSAGILPLSCDKESGQKAGRFKGMVIGGGGIFEARHYPLDCESFAEGLGEKFQVALFGIGASQEAIWSAPIIKRAKYVSGRDKKSVLALSNILKILEENGEKTVTKPENVVMVRDPVLSDGYFSDVNGRCWQQSQGHPMTKPLCFVLPSTSKEELKNLHRIYSSGVVHKNDVLINVFPKHQAEIEEYPYPTEIEQLLDPSKFASRLCACRAVISSRLHGTIIALHSGVPTIAAWPVSTGNKIPDLMKDVLEIPDQFILVDDNFNRQVLGQQIIKVRNAYKYGGRRELIFDKLSAVSQNTEKETFSLLHNFFHLILPENGGRPVGEISPMGKFWNEPGHSGLLPTSEPTVAATLPSPTPSPSPSPSTVVIVKTAPTPQPEGATPQPEGATPQLKGATPQPEGAVPQPEGSRLCPRKVETGQKVLGTIPKGILLVRWSMPWVGGAEGETSHSMEDSLLVSLVAVVMIVLLGMPALASLSESKPPASSMGNPQVSLEENGGAATVTHQPLDSPRPHRVTNVIFFGMNYIIWVCLSIGFSACSKAYMCETQNPVALLAIQGWVGVAVLCSMNFIARLRLRHRSPSNPSASSPSWYGKCGMRQARRSERRVWQAGLLHSTNAVLTSWSVLIGGVAATHALKALEPVAAAGFSWWFLGSTLAPARAAAIGIIVLGLCVLMVPFHLPSWAGGSSQSGDFAIGSNSVLPVKLAIPALLTTTACCAVALRNVLLKNANPPPPPLSLLVCSIVSAAIGTSGLLAPFLPFSWEWAGESLVRASGLNAAFCFVGFNLASFNLLSQLSPVGHAVGNASKRLCVFAAGLFLLGEEGSLSPRQLTGAAIAFVGLASYNLVGSSTRWCDTRRGARGDGCGGLLGS